MTTVINKTEKESIRWKKMSGKNFFSYLEFRLFLNFQAKLKGGKKNHMKMVLNKTDGKSIRRKWIF